MLSGLLPSPALAATPPLHQEVLVFIPAYEASQLFDPELRDGPPDHPTCVWGNLNVFFSKTLYFALRLPNPLLPRILLAVGPVDIYRGFVERMTERRKETPRFAPYTQGSDFFIFPYDWRQDIATVTAPQFARAMESYARLHAQKTGIPAAQTHFIIVTHSMGGLVARTWLSENPAWSSRITRLYLVGSPNRGSVKAVRTIIYGPDSLHLIFDNVDQNVTKLTGITRPSLYELLPLDDPHWTQTKPHGERQSFSGGSLLEASTWEPFWPSAELEQHVFIDDWLRKRQAEGRQQIVPADWEFCQDPTFGHLRQLLGQTAAFRSRQGSLQHTSALLTTPGQPTRLRLIFSTGIKTAAGLVSHGEHDSTQATYTYPNNNDGDGTVEEWSALDGFSRNAPNVKVLHRVPHGKLMINAQFLSYFTNELSDQPLVRMQDDVSDDSRPGH